MANQIVLQVLDPLSADINGLKASISVTSPNDPTLAVRVSATSNSREGGLVFDLLNQRLPLKYDYYVTVTVAKQAVSPNEYLDSSIRKTIRLTDAGNGVDWDNVDLGSWSVPVVEATISIATKKIEVQNAYDTYVTAKAAYEAVIANASNIELEQLETYEPANPTYITTRLLEFQEGTLKAAIRYALDAKLDTNLAYLTRINDFLAAYVALYPDVSIDDGEGIPYQ
jgi:hypothetical protein